MEKTETKELDYDVLDIEYRMSEVDSLVVNTTTKKIKCLQDVLYYGLVPDETAQEIHGEGVSKSVFTEDQTSIITNKIIELVGKL